MKVIDNASKVNTLANYTIQADQKELDHAKTAVLNSLAKTAKIAGFRQGKAPIEIVEKNVNQQTLQSEVLNHVVGDLYSQSVDEKQLIVVGQPQINITKFVPFSTLEFKVEVEIISGLKVGDYKNFNLKPTPNPVTDKQLDQTLEEIRQRSATYSKVSRPAKNGDRLTIDFTGVDFKTKEVLESATAKDYYLVLGSNSFIPGFETNLIGQKEGQEKTFPLTFPKDYFDKSFQSRKVSFSVTVKAIEEAKLDSLDDKFAAKIGPFKTLKELRDQLKVELKVENDRLARQKLDNQIIDKLVSITKCVIPESVIEAETTTISRYDQEAAVNNGLTWSEFLARQGLSEAEYTKGLKPAAEKRIKSGLALVEIAKIEGLSVKNEELEEEVSNLKKRYTDPKMQEELSSDAVKSDLTKRLLTQKVLDYLRNL